MYALTMIFGLMGMGVGAWWACRRNVDLRQRRAAGLLAGLALVVVVLAWVRAPNRIVRRYDAAARRQDYVLGFGLGQHLKQTQPDRKVFILRLNPESKRDAEVIKGIKEVLAGALTIVGERTPELTVPPCCDPPFMKFTPELLAELKSAGADIVISFAGLPLGRTSTGAIDSAATLALWATPEFQALQWVLPHPPEVQVPSPFQHGRVLVAVHVKPQSANSGQIPAYLKIKGTPAELFNAWFELITSDDGG